MTSFASEIYVADTNHRKRGEVWKKLNSIDANAGPEWLLIEKQIVSFHNLKEPPFDTICDAGTCESFKSYEWANSEDEDTKRQFVQLLNLCLKQRNWLLGLRFNRDQGCYHFQATKDLRTRKVYYRGLENRVSREVFKQYSKKSDPSLKAYCRHLAFEGQFLRLGGKWYLEITPTYRFTSDGYKADKFGGTRLQGIKRLDRNPAVFGQLLMWESFLGKPIKTFFSSEYPFLCFGQLATVATNSSLPDKVWYNVEEGDEAKILDKTENQLALFD